MHRNIKKHRSTTSLKKGLYDYYISLYIDPWIVNYTLCAALIVKYHYHNISATFVCELVLYCSNSWDWTLWLCASLSKYILVFFCFGCQPHETVFPGNHQQIAIYSVECVDDCSFYVCDLLEINKAKIHNEMLHTSRQCYFRDVCKISKWSAGECFEQEQMYFSASIWFVKPVCKCVIEYDMVCGAFL